MDPLYARLRPALRKRYKAGLARAQREGWSDWIREYQDAVAVASGCWMDVGQGARYCEFIETHLRQSKGEWAGEPLQLLGWQRGRVFMPLFGWRREDGTRRFRKAYIHIPKKNGKSTMCSALEICLLVLDQEPGAEVYSAASDREQARITWCEGANMVEASPDLSEILTVHNHVSTVNYPALHAQFKALSGVPKSAEGLNTHGLVCDEFHQWTDRRLWGALKYGGASRRQPLIVIITTAGDDITSACHEEYEYACKLRDGVLENWSYLAVIYEASPDDDWKDPKVWRKANPSMGVTIQEEDFREAVREVEGKPAQVADFKRYRLNIWQQSANPWLTIETWDGCGVEGLTLEDME